ncbi:class I SAM-dependent methyltransferase [Myxococcus sp. K15C18031901]|uniref:class I SAM-dependent methyltransferase n=1 Tax=Myxococcus dinghuensis TaxID=2906761 RepID=UPI0020A7FAD7|nr:class I SAM-dependent methyltransferase [Myxococcus dinghuensis]MCP3098370.1 class I SAM-dependent methyltransferase [Myxococcus dinghuensis]
MQVDFGRTSADYTRHRAGFPDAFFDRLARDGHLRAGLRALDLGTGTGTVARGLAQRGCSVTALDVSTPLLAAARQLAADAGLSIDFREAPAEETGLPSGTFDLLTAGQCWHWFHRPTVAREATRLLAPGGRIVIAHFDWVCLRGNLAQATEDLMSEFNPNPPAYEHFANGVGIYTQWLRDISDVGFTNLETCSFDVPVFYSPTAWRGRCRASAKVGASLPPAKVERFDAALARILAERFPGERLDIPHRVFILTATRP